MADQFQQLDTIEMNDVFGGLTMQGMADAYRNPKHMFNDIITINCPGCGTPIECKRLFAPLTQCDACIQKKLQADAMERYKIYWEHICPPSFRDTDKNHAGFPKPQYEQLRAYMGTESLLMYGPSRIGKTRLAMLLLKRCLVKRGMHVGVLWPEQLKQCKWMRDTLQWVEKYGKYELLLMDDALLTGAQDEHITSCLKDLIDYRMRFKRFSIITSQVGSSDYSDAADKYGNITPTDRARVDAMLKRIKETFRVISFKEVKPKQGEEPF